MNPRVGPHLVLPLALVLGCPLPGEVVTCEEETACGTTTSASTSSDGEPTGGETPTGTGDGGITSSGSTAFDVETGGETTGTTGQPADAPTIVERAVIPNYTDINTILEVTVATKHAAGVLMQLETGGPIELTAIRPGEFGGQISAFTGLDNGKHAAIFTPWRDALVGESVSAEYVIALPEPAYEVAWQTPDIDGHVAAIDVLPDGRPVEFGTFYEMGEPRCYLQLRETTGAPVEFVQVLPPAHCTAIELKIDRETGVMNVLLERKGGDGLRWWAGQIPEWGLGPENIGLGADGDTALGLATRPGLVAVCGAKPVATTDKLDGLAVLLRPNLPAQELLFDYRPGLQKHKFAETFRDCAFANDTLVLVGDSSGQHEPNIPTPRDRLTVLEHDITSNMDVWTVAGPGPGVQSRGLAVDVDDEGRYHLAVYTCLDACEPEGEVRIYAPGGKLVGQISLGPLGSDAFGPHDIAWSPAGYAVIALAEQQGQSYVFKVQAFAPGNYDPLWTFLPGDKQGFQIAFAVAVGPYGEIYAGGLAETSHPAFAVIGG